MQTQNKVNMNMNMLKILSSLMIVTLAVGCGGGETGKKTRQETERVEQVCPVPKHKYMDMTELGRLCNSDSVHNKSLMFVSPYCGGTIHRFRERINPAMATMDTTDWKFYYIVEVDEDDTLDYNNLMVDCYRIGIDTNSAYIWRHGTYKEDYNQVFAMFKSIKPLENSASGVPRNILLDKQNYIAVYKVTDYDNRDSAWYELRGIYDDIHTINNMDFSVEDTSYHLMVRISTTSPKNGSITLVGE